MARIPVVLAARAANAVGNRAPAHAPPGPPATPDPAVRAPRCRTPERTVGAAHRDAARASRDDSVGALITPAPKGIEDRPQGLTHKKATAAADAATLIRHPEWRENHRWILKSTVLGYVEPSYGGTSRSGCNGWVGRPPNSMTASGRRCTTRENADVEPAMSWVRVVTATPRRTITGD